jgi:DNA modification methylase
MSVRVEQIGAATLFLGDSRDVLPTLTNGSVDFIFTDPPYGHNNNNGDLIAKREQALGRGSPGAPRPIANDGTEANELVRWFFGEANRLLAGGGCCCCCCGGGGPDPQFARWSLWLDDALGFKQMIVWDKGPMGMGWHYRRSYETVLVGEKRGGKCRWFDTAGDVENIIRPGRIRKLIPRESDHPTPKDPNLALHFIRLHTREGDVVLDPFMGAGSTMLAAINSRRRFIGVEIEPRWFDVSVEHAIRLREQNEFLQFATPTPATLDLFERPYDETADLAGSYYAAVEEIGRRVKAGEPVPEYLLRSGER